MATARNGRPGSVLPNEAGCSRPRNARAPRAGASAAPSCAPGILRPSGDLPRPARSPGGWPTAGANTGRDGWQKHAGQSAAHGMTPQVTSPQGVAGGRRPGPAQPGIGRLGARGIPGKTLRATAKSATRPTKIGRRRVATGANHPASHSSAFRRGPERQQVLRRGPEHRMHVTPKPPCASRPDYRSRRVGSVFLTAAPGRHHRA